MDRYDPYTDSFLHDTQYNILGTNLASLGTDCISRQAAIDATKKRYRAHDNDLLELIAFDIERLPSAEPKRGRWIGKYPVTSVCSECGFLIHDSKVKAFAYCPNFGADMRGEEHGLQ